MVDDGLMVGVCVTGGIMVVVELGLMVGVLVDNPSACLVSAGVMTFMDAFVGGILLD